MDKIIVKDTKEELDVWSIARSMTPQNMADILDEYMNVGMKDYREGVSVGLLLRYAHRSIQGSIFRFMLGVFKGLSEQEYTDARNEIAVKSAKKITAMVEDGSLEKGFLI